MSRTSSQLKGSSSELRLLRGDVAQKWLFPARPSTRSRRLVDSGTAATDTYDPELFMTGGHSDMLPLKATVDRHGTDSCL